MSVRIHVLVPDDLHHRAKAAAALRGITLKDYVNEALADAVALDERRQPGKR